jgi:hypothetical protein
MTKLPCSPINMALSGSWNKEEVLNRNENQMQSLESPPSPHFLNSALRCKIAMKQAVLERYKLAVEVLAKGGQTAILVRWSAGPLLSGLPKCLRTSGLEKIADHRN